VAPREERVEASAAPEPVTKPAQKPREKVVALPEQREAKAQAATPTIQPIPETTPAVAPPARSKLPLVIGVVAIVVVAILVKLMWPTIAGRRSVKPTPTAAAQTSPLPVSPGTLVVNAVPWGRVTEVVDGQGRRQELPADVTTPLVLALSPGRYTITVTGPDGAAGVKLLAEVGPGATTRVLAEVKKGDPDELLRQLGW
jgi:hypothetical protein